MLARAFLALFVLCFACDCDRVRSCAPGGGADVKVKMGKLAADPLAAARELGTAAATEKDEDVLEGKLLAFFERVGLPVVSRDGEELIAKAPYDPPKTLMLWEPSVAGLARGVEEETKTFPISSSAGIASTKGELTVTLVPVGD